MIYRRDLTPFGADIPTLATAQHSLIRQEADYIHERITAATALHRKLTSEIRSAERKLDRVRQAKSSDEPMITSLKRGIRKRRSRLNRCARNLATFEDRLAAISMQMQSLQQRQWRRSAPQLYGLEKTSTGSGVHLAGGTSCRPDWSALTSFNLPRPGTPALCAYPLQVEMQMQVEMEMEMEIEMQSQHHPIVGYGYVPRTPVLRPVHVPRLAATRSLQPEANQCHAHVLDGPVEMDISPTNTVSPYDLDPPRGFPAIGHVDLADAVRGLCISQGQLGHVPVVQEPNPADHRGEVEVEVAGDLSLPRSLGMLGQESAGLRLQRLARNGEGT